MPSTYDPIKESKLLNMKLYGSETPTATQTKQQVFYWKCTSCGIPDQICTKEEMVVQAGQHDLEKHKKKPTTTFGYKVV